MTQKISWELYISAVITAFHFLIAAPAQAQEIIKLDEHQAFFADLKQAEDVDSKASQLQKEVQDTDNSKPTIAEKDEFETVAQYQARVKTAEDDAASKNAKRLQAIYQTIADLEVKSAATTEALNRKQNSLAEITTCVKVKMNAFDAETGQITSFTPELSVFGEYDKRVAAVAVAGDLHGFQCTVDLARKLRAASDKNNLCCVIRFKTPKLRMVHAVIELPMTTSGKVGQFLGRLGTALTLSAVGGQDSVDGFMYGTPAKQTTSYDANTIRIDSFDFAEFLGFYDDHGVIVRGKQD